MPRLTPINQRKQIVPTGITSVNLSLEMVDKLRDEQIRVGAKSRSDLVRMILESYFEEEV